MHSAHSSKTISLSHDERRAVDSKQPGVHATLSLLDAFSLAKLDRQALQHTATECATASLIKFSPAPVQETAQVLLAKVPAPMIGLSPTRRYSLLFKPPVDVPVGDAPFN